MKELGIILNAKKSVLFSSRGDHISGCSVELKHAAGTFVFCSGWVDLHSSQESERMLVTHCEAVPENVKCFCLSGTWFHTRQAVFSMVAWAYSFPKVFWRSSSCWRGTSLGCIWNPGSQKEWDAALHYHTPCIPVRDLLQLSESNAKIIYRKRL